MGVILHSKMSTGITKKEIKAIYEISKAITSDMYLEDILKLIVSVTAEITGSKICSIMLVDEKTNTIKIRATQSMSNEYIKKEPLKIGEGIAGKVVKEGVPIYIEDVRESNEYKYRDIAKTEKLISMLSVPMKVKNKVIGVLNIYTPVVHKFSEKEVEIISSIANQAAIVIENTELMVKTKILEEELETRKKVEKAKGILMKDLGIDENEAFEKLRKASMDKRKSLREIAESIIIASEIRGK